MGDESYSYKFAQKNVIKVPIFNVHIKRKRSQPTKVMRYLRCEFYKIKLLQVKAKSVETKEKLFQNEN